MKYIIMTIVLLFAYSLFYTDSNTVEEIHIDEARQTITLSNEWVGMTMTFTNGTLASITEVMYERQ